MTQDQGWNERLDALLTGVLAIWRVDGHVVRNDYPSTSCTILHESDRITVERVTDDGDAPYWEVTGLVSGNPVPSLPYAGIQGMLRAVRDLLDPEGSAVRLVIGPQSGVR